MYTHTGSHALKYVLTDTKKHKVSSNKTEERNVVSAADAAVRAMQRPLILSSQKGKKSHPEYVAIL